VTAVVSAEQLQPIRVQQLQPRGYEVGPSDFRSQATSSSSFQQLAFGANGSHVADPTPAAASPIYMSTMPPELAEIATPNPTYNMGRYQSKPARNVERADEADTVGGTDEHAGDTGGARPRQRHCWVRPVLRNV
jgi:hypothetical protein